MSIWSVHPVELLGGPCDGDRLMALDETLWLAMPVPSPPHQARSAMYVRESTRRMGFRGYVTMTTKAQT